MNKKWMSLISVVLGIAIFVVGVEAMTRFRLDMIKIPVLKEGLKDRSQILEEDIKWVYYPRKYIGETSIVESDDLLNHYVKLNHTLYADMPISLNSVETLEMSHDDAILRLHENQSAFSMKSDLAKSFGGILNLGHRVDISLVRKGRSGSETEVKLFLKQVRIIGAKDKKGADVQVGEIPAVILLAIDNEALPILLQYQSEGELVLTMVEKTGEEECILEGVSLDE